MAEEVEAEIEEEEEECPKCPPVGAPAWMATFADMATLLMAFFVLILSFAEFNVPKFKQISGSLKNAAGLSHASNQAIRIDETGGVILNSTGSAGNPSYAFFADFDTGLFMQSAANIGVSLAGTEEFRFASGGSFHADADVVAFSNTVSSDFRLKENIEPLTDNLQKVLRLKPSSYNWKIRDKQEDVGFIAQDVEQIIPMVVKENTSIGTTKDFLGSETHKTVDYAKMVTYLVGAIQEQQEQIDKLKKKLEEL